MGAVLWSVMLCAVLCATQPLQPLQISWERRGEGRGRGTTGVKADMRGSGKSAPMMGHMGKCSYMQVVWWGSGADFM